MKYIVAALLFLFPTSVVRFIANLTGGYRIARGAKVGFSFIIADRIVLERDARVGSLNLIKVEELNIRGGV